ncbi:hypothetical protein [Prochlorococcus sp. MIT 1306]|uniref:hypothetical protein n=1 Tax=Prochlorococcus sp. MIT 1306 TaxID=1799667 RepID=UPI0007B325E1|nr:hypothetical protein [Prochlorococcus sp. MIT 1306]KZR63122.1 hypothetical protein PMIT1306_01605 [Prochlorococcus sp. MIT 1306]
MDGDLHGQSVSADERNVLVGGIGIGYDFGSIRADMSAHRWHDIGSFSGGGYKYDPNMNNLFWRVGLGLALDIPTNSNCTPCLHAGGGPIWGDKTNDAAWVYGGGIGVTYAASEEVDVLGQVSYGWAPLQTIDNVNTDASGPFGAEAGLCFRL